MMTTTITTAPATMTETVQGRFNNALKAIRKQGVSTRMNAQSCCTDCDGPEASGHPEVVWTYGSQEGTFSWVDGVMVYRNIMNMVKRRTGSAQLDAIFRANGRVTKLYFNHTSVEAASIAAMAFNVEGFEVAWDGADTECVIVTIR
jgi:hypothetical protein